MKTAPSFRRLLALLSVFGFAAGLLAQPTSAVKEPGNDPAPLKLNRFQSSIDAFVAADKMNPPPSGGILFIGSSIIRKWTTLTEQMAPLPAFNRGFGGSRTPEVLHYADQIALPYSPKIVVYYCGSNDINAGVKPPEIAANFRAFVEKIHSQLPKTRVLFVSIIRAPQKMERWDWVDDANKLIKSYCESDPRLGFIDVNPAVFDRQGKARMDLYLPDQLHYLPPAYVKFTAIIKPVLVQVWKEVQ